MSWPGLKGKRTLPGGVAAQIGESGLSVTYWSTDRKGPERGAVVRPHGVQTWTVESREGGRLVGFLSYPAPGQAQDEAERFVAGSPLDVRARRAARPLPPPKRLREGMKLEWVSQPARAHYDRLHDSQGWAAIQPNPGPGPRWQVVLASVVRKRRAVLVRTAGEAHDVAQAFAWSGELPEGARRYRGKW